ncbi:MAG: signal recognition particle protein [Candidatus Eremiobacteraeota bacterium]|nr:signal recognition particle protein [Candidatus Eremiobacteraeota bacterium]MBV9056070.1 signal recognition particle protein [Candidatus Eremiobacteraeota bacterium]MBV9699516.1 signal recognition particle protein [Candidatus Eremiobacteraeota bacterium]
MFDQLERSLGAVFDRLTGRGRISESDVNEALREVRIALLEADVSLAAAKEFVAKVRDAANGANVLESLTPAQTILKIVHEQLVDLLGPSTASGRARLKFSDAPPSVILMVGLQGSGKTTTAGKLALRLKEQGRRSLLVAADVYRPAAIEQLETLGKQIDLPVYQRGTGDPVRIVGDAVAEARRLALSTVIVDTAGRLQIDEPLMAELERIKAVATPCETLLVADAMTGQEATNVAKGFHDRLGISGVILTKLDGDTRGGAALSIHRVTGAPIKFSGVGEKLSALEPFYPERLASRILGMGDALTLIEKTQQIYSEAQAKQLEDKLFRTSFTLDDFLDQMRQVRKIGSIGDLLKMVPGLSKALPKNFEIPEREFVKVEAIISSMTRGERRNPQILNGSRRKRIARGSGTEVADVNRLVKQFEQAKDMTKQLGGKRRGRLAPFRLAQ